MNLLDTLIQKFPNAGPKNQALFNDAEQKLQLLEADNSTRAGAIRKQLADTISNGRNPSVLLKSLDKMYFSSLSRAEKSSSSSESKPSIAPEEAISQIENALNIGDERAIKLPDQDIKSAAFAYGKGDLKGAAKIADKLVERINTAIKLQDEEEKDIRTTAEGIQVAIGKKTGTVYTGGIPASRGRENTGSFNSFLAQQGVREEMIYGTSPSDVIGGETQPAPMIGELETVQPQPELYSQQTRPESDTGVPKTTQYIVRARELYKQGNVQGALDILNATNLPSVYGELNEDSLRDILGVQPQQPTPTEAPQATQVPTGNERPSLDSIMNPKKTK
jgi:hypothetical protein